MCYHKILLWNNMDVDRYRHSPQRPDHNDGHP